MKKILLSALLITMILVSMFIVPTIGTSAIDDYLIFKDGEFKNGGEIYENCGTIIKDGYLIGGEGLKDGERGVGWFQIFIDDSGTDEAYNAYKYLAITATPINSEGTSFYNCGTVEFGAGNEYTFAELEKDGKEMTNTAKTDTYYLDLDKVEYFEYNRLLLTNRAGYKVEAIWLTGEPERDRASEKEEYPIFANGYFVNGGEIYPDCGTIIKDRCLIGGEGLKNGERGNGWFQITIDDSDSDEAFRNYKYLAITLEAVPANATNGATNGAVRFGVNSIYNFADIEKDGKSMTLEPKKDTYYFDLSKVEKFEKNILLLSHYGLGYKVESIWLSDNASGTAPNIPDRKPTEPGKTFSKTKDGVTLSVTLDKASYGIGRKIVAVATIENNSGKSIYPFFDFNWNGAIAVGIKHNEEGSFFEGGYKYSGTYAMVAAMPFAQELKDGKSVTQTYAFNGKYFGNDEYDDMASKPEGHLPEAGIYDGEAWFNFALNSKSQNSTESLKVDFEVPIGVEATKDDENTSGNGKTFSNTKDDVTISVTLDKESYKIGEPIVAKAVLKNNSDKMIHYMFHYSLLSDIGIYLERKNTGDFGAESVIPTEQPRKIPIGGTISSSRTFDLDYFSLGKENYLPEAGVYKGYAQFKFSYCEEPYERNDQEISVDFEVVMEDEIFEGSYNSKDLESSSSINSKLSDELIAELDKMSSDDEISVYLWLKDIDHDLVEQNVKLKIGINMSDMESLSQEIYRVYCEKNNINFEQFKNHSLGFQIDSNDFLKDTEEIRKEVNDKVDNYISTSRQMEKEMYEKNNKEFFSDLNIDESKMIFKSMYSPMHIVTLTKDEILRVADDDRVTDISLYKEETPENGSAEPILSLEDNDKPENKPSNNDPAYLDEDNSDDSSTDTGNVLNSVIAAKGEVLNSVIDAEDVIDKNIGKSPDKKPSTQKSIYGHQSSVPNPATGVEGIAIALAVSAIALGGFVISKKIK